MNITNTANIIGWLSLLMSTSASHEISQPSDVGEDVQVVVNDIVTKELSIPGVSRHSSQCWMTSITAMDQLINPPDESKFAFTSGSSYCAAMSDNHLDALALELTRCELLKARRDVFIDQSTEATRSDAAATNVCPILGSEPYQLYNLVSCLELLTDHAHVIYHQIRLHVKSLCYHLADEMLQHRREETSKLLAIQIKDVLTGTTSVLEQLHSQSYLLQNHSHLLKEHQMDLEKMYEQRKREEASQTLLMKEHQFELEQMLVARKRDQVEENRLRKLREESTLKLMQQQSDLMKSQQIDFQDMLKAKEELLEEKVKERMRQLDQMQEMIATAHSQIRPLSKIEAYVKMATDGFSIFKALLAFFLSMNIVWICTSLPFLNHGRKGIYIVMTLGFIAEIVAIIYENGLIEQLGEMNAIGIIRYWTRVCGIVIWFLSCFTSCLYPQGESSDQYDSRLDDLLRSQMEFVSKLNATQTEDISGSQPQVQKKKQPLTNAIRKYHAGTKRSRLPADRHPKHFKPIITPSRPPIDISKLRNTSNAKESRQRNTITILKEMQRQHNDTDTENSTAEFPSYCNESSFFGGTDDESTCEPPPKTAPQCVTQESRKTQSSKKPSRKRKYSEASDDWVVLHDAQRDDGSVSSVSTESLPSKDTKKSKNKDVTIY